MNAVESVLAFDLSGLSPVQQLILIRLADIVPNEPEVSSEYLGRLCNCSKLTVYSSIKKLKSVGAINIKYKKGRANSYSLLFDYSQDSSSGEDTIADFDQVDDYHSSDDFEPDELVGSDDFEPDEPADSDFLNEDADSELARFRSLVSQSEIIEPTLPSVNAKNIKNRNKRKKRKK